MMSVSMPSLRRDLHRRTGQLLLLGLHVDAVEPRRVPPEYLFLDLVGELHAAFRGDVYGDLEVPELLDEPLRRPDRVVRPEEQVVLAHPEEQLGQHLGEIPRAGVDERQRHGKPAIDVRFLHRDPAEIVQPRQAAMLDDPVQVLEIGGRVVHVMHVEGVLGQGNDRRALVHVDIPDPELVAQLEALVGIGIVQGEALGGAVPFRGVDLHTLDIELFLHVVVLFERLLAVAGIEGSVDDEAFRMALGHRRAALDRGKSLLVKVAQHGGLDDRHVVRTIDEQVTVDVVLRILLEPCLLPQMLRRAQVRVVGVEAINELLAVHVRLVLGAAVPEMRMSVEHEYLFVVFGLVHGVLPNVSLNCLEAPGPVAGWPRSVSGCDQMYSITSFMSPKSTTVSSSTRTIRPYWVEVFTSKVSAVMSRPR